MHCANIDISHNHGIILGKIDFSNAVIPISTNRSYASVIHCRDNKGFICISIIIRIQEQNIACASCISIRQSEDSCIFCKTHHVIYAGAPGNSLLRYICIVQTESKEHCRPVPIGISVPLSISGNTEFCLAIFGKYVVLFAFSIADLRFCHKNEVVRPLTGQLGWQRCLPNGCSFEISSIIGIAGQLMDVLFVATQICNFVAAIGMDMLCGFLSSFCCFAGNSFFCSITLICVGVFRRRTSQIPLNLIAHIGVLMPQSAGKDRLGCVAVFCMTVLLCAYQIGFLNKTVISMFVFRVTYLGRDNLITAVLMTVFYRADASLFLLVATVLVFMRGSTYKNSFLCITSVSMFMFCEGTH